jgi:hypothetical protein
MMIEEIYLAWVLVGMTFLSELLNVLYECLLIMCISHICPYTTSEDTHESNSI